MYTRECFLLCEEKNTEVKAQRIPEVISLIDNTACTVVKFCDFRLRNVSQSPAQRSSLPGVSPLHCWCCDRVSYSPRGIPNAHPVWIHHELQSLTSVHPCVRALLAPISCTHKTCTTPLRAHRAAEALTHSQVNVGLAWLLDLETPVRLFCLDYLLTWNSYSFFKIQFNEHFFTAVFYNTHRQNEPLQHRGPLHLATNQNSSLGRIF